MHLSSCVKCMLTNFGNIIYARKILLHLVTMHSTLIWNNQLSRIIRQSGNIETEGEKNPNQITFPMIKTRGNFQPGRILRAYMNERTIIWHGMGLNSYRMTPWIHSCVLYLPFAHCFLSFSLPLDLALNASHSRICIFACFLHQVFFIVTGIFIPNKSLVF